MTDEQQQTPQGEVFMAPAGTPLPTAADLKDWRAVGFLSDPVEFVTQGLDESEGMRGPISGEFPAVTMTTEIVFPNPSAWDLLVPSLGERGVEARERIATTWPCRVCGERIPMQAVVTSSTMTDDRIILDAEVTNGETIREHALTHPELEVGENVPLSIHVEIGR